jgi:hypothetical protein
MTGSDRPPPTADAQGGDVDATLLSELRDLYIAGDPVPPDLVDHVLFSITLADLELEVCRLTEPAPLEIAGARGTEEHTVRATFDSDPLTIMVEWTALIRGGAWLWLAPPGAPGGVRTTSRTLTTTAVQAAGSPSTVPRGLAPDRRSVRSERRRPCADGGDAPSFTL